MLFTVDSIPEPGQRPQPIRGLSEFPGFPLVHGLLASGSPRLCQSLVWPEHRIGILGDYAEGVTRLEKFLDSLGKLDPLPDDLDFQDAVANARAVLASPKYRGRYVVLEPGELLRHESEDLASEAQQHLEREIGVCLRALDILVGGEQLPPWLARLPETWKEELGLYFTSTLYYEPAP